jgi:hypothetical protein
MPEAKMHVEKRDHPRMSVLLPVQYYFAEAVEELDHIVEWRKQDINALVLDLSLSGMHVVVDQKFLTGTVVRFDINIPGKSESLTLYAEVAWSNEKGAGLHFLEMMEEDVECLKAYMEKIAASS